MNEIKVDFSKTCGNVKPMHAVNNGPVHKFAADQQISNLQYYKDAGIPYARTHDASYCATYGGEHTVDVHAIFPDFNANPYSPDSYDFACTDEYLRVIDAAGTKTFYRLGSKIEHFVKKYGTVPPSDFHKWAVICEHIIRHYTEGWANGFEYDIEYWEIWNEPECTSASGQRTCWQGTDEDFIEFFCTALEHLTKRFPNLKIGGPAFTSVYPEKLIRDLLSEIKRRNLRLDFFSWHRYAYDPNEVFANTVRAREYLDEYGFTETESILNEWNYVKGWQGDDFVYSINAIKSIKGAAYTAAVMCGCQYTTLDMLMYYDARPSGFNGMFNTDIVSIRLKTYYSMKMFNELYKLETCVEKPEVNADNIYICAAKGSGKDALMMVHYSDNDADSAKTVNVKLEGMDNGKTVKCYLLDSEHDMELMCERKLDENNEIQLEMPLHSVYLLIAE